MRRIAITGGIAEGKSTVLQNLAEAGYETASADLFARELLEIHDVKTRVSEALKLPEDFTREDLRSIVLSQLGARRTLNRLLHGPILERIMDSTATFHEVPLVVETCLLSWFSEVWVVTCGVAEQRRRLRARYGEMADIDALLSWQLPTAVKIAFADKVIRTDCPPEFVRMLVLQQASIAG